MIAILSGNAPTDVPEEYKLLRLYLQKSGQYNILDSSQMNV